MQPLNTGALGSLAQCTDPPRYTRDPSRIGVVHLGLGAFHRAHQAAVFDTLLRRGDPRWTVLGVAMRSTELADALAAQDGLYTVQVASREGIAWQVPGAIVATAVAARERERVLQAIAAPGTRWVTLTVTEKGYGPDLAELLAEGLARRHAAGHAPLTVASCDNLSGNGGRLRALCVQATQARGPALADWVERHCAFPDSMVDRIVPAGTAERQAQAADALGVHDRAALATEGFWEWVIESRFADPSDAAVLAGAGVRVVPDVRPFEEAKLRLLNGSHSAMACIGAVAGLPHIADTVAQPAVRRFVEGLMTHEVGPHLTRPDWPAYRDALLARFGNPHLKHSVHQVATDSSQKIPQRWPPSIGAQIAHARPVERLAFAAAAWMRWCRGEDEHGRPIPVSDPMAEPLHALAKAHAGNAAATVAALGTLVPVWGAEVAGHAAWHARVAHWLDAIEQHGLLPALDRLPA